MLAPNRIFRWLFRIGICCAVALPAIAAEYRVTPVALNDENLDTVVVGRLSWRGGIAIDGDDPRFGGLSALHVSDDGEKLLAITDRGGWLTATLEYRDGALANARDFELSRLLDLRGKPVQGRNADAESLAVNEESAVVSFERNHRLWRYAGPSPTRSLPTPIAVPTGMGKLPGNGGIEALTRLCDGRLLAVSEKGYTGNSSVVGWIQTRTGWTPLEYRTVAGSRPTGAATLPNCDVVFVERSFSFVAGLDIRVTRVRRGAIAAGAVLEPMELAHMTFPLTIDNFEGIAARRNAAGNTLIYLISDDNFSAAQRTLLVMFELTE